MDFINTWWDTLDLGLQFFYAIAIVATLILVAQTALMIFGIGDADGGDIDLDADSLDHDGGGHILSVRTVVAFLVGFGWTGVICLKSGIALPTTVILSLATGVALMMGIFFVMRFLYSLRETGTLDFKNAIGEVGTVYLPIPPARESPGQVEVMIQGRLMVVDAFTNAPEKLDNRTKVRVVDTVGSNSLLVEPLGALTETTTP